MDRLTIAIERLIALLTQSGVMPQQGSGGTCDPCQLGNCTVHTNPDTGPITVLDIDCDKITPKTFAGRDGKPRMSGQLDLMIHNEMQFINRGNNSVQFGCDCIPPGGSLPFGSKNDRNLYRLKKVQVTFLEDDPMCIIGPDCPAEHCLVIWTADDCSTSMLQRKKSIR